MEIKVEVDAIAGIEAGAIVVNFFEGMEHPEGDTATVDKALGGAISQLISQGEIKGKLSEITIIHSLGRLPTARVVVVGLGKKPELSVNKVRGAVAETCRWLRKKGVASVATIAQGDGINGISLESAAQAVTEGALLGLYAFRRHITKKDNEFGEIKELLIVGHEEPRLESGITRGRILAEAANWARDLGNEPANYMTPSRMAEAARKMAKSYGLKVEVLEKKQMEAAGMGALLGVAREASSRPNSLSSAIREAIPIRLI